MDKKKKEILAKLYLDFLEDLHSARVRRYDAIKAAREKMDKEKVEKILKNE